MILLFSFLNFLLQSSLTYENTFISQNKSKFTVLLSGIGIEEALSTLNKYYTIDNIDIRKDPHQKYIADIEADAEAAMESGLFKFLTIH